MSRQLATRHTRCAIIVLFGLAVTAPLARAQPITIPEGLPSGEEYRLAFVTQGTTNATNPNYGYYQSFVNSQANSNPDLAALGTPWQPIVSVASSGTDARDFTDTNPFTDPKYRIYNLDGNLVANANSQLWGPSHSAPINVDQNGNIKNTPVWTGTTPDGRKPPSNSLGNTVPVYGQSGLTTTSWTAQGTANLGNALSLYGLSDVLTVPDITTVPTGLNPGDPYRLAFVTDAVIQATSKNPSTYQNFVASQVFASAALSALGVGWSPIVSTLAGPAARDLTDTNPGVWAGVPIYNLGDDLLAVDNADFWDGSLANSINITQSGAHRYADLVWTGTIPNGLPANPLGSGSPVYGLSTGSGSQWVALSSISPVGAFRLYAISDVLFVPQPQAVPEPGTFALASLLTGLAGLGYRRRKGAGS